MQAVLKEQPRCTLSVSVDMHITNLGELVGWCCYFCLLLFFSYYESNSGFKQIPIGFFKSCSEEACLNVCKYRTIFQVSVQSSASRLVLFCGIQDHRHSPRGELDLYMPWHNISYCNCYICMIINVLKNISLFL